MIATLKEAVHRMIEASPIPTRTLAEELGISYSYLMNAGNPDLPDFKLPARHLIPLTRLTGDYSAIDFIENSLGRAAFKLPDADVDIIEAQKKLLATVNRFGTLVKNATEALEDGRIVPKEAVQLEHDAYALITETLRFVNSIEHCCESRRGYVR